MRLVFIHGAPAVGKLTIAKELARLTQAKLFDNHAAIDVARTVFDFGAPGFWELVDTTRVSVVEAAARNNVPLVVMTACYSEPEDIPLFQRYVSMLARYGSKILPVFLHCSEHEMLRRVTNKDRAERQKISSPTGLKTFLAEYNLVPVQYEGCIHIDSGRYAANEAAQKIADHFELV